MSNEIIVSSQSNFLAPAAQMDEILIAYQMKKEFIERVLREGVDFGSIPGSEKKTLLKPGSEKLNSLFGLHPQFEDVETVEDWTGSDHDGESFFYYRQKCKLYRGEQLIASADGSCNSWEKKYRYRQEDRKCPTCGKETIIKGREEYGGGWLCYRKKGGCGAKFNDDAPSIVNQNVGQIKNPDVAEQVNTILKMAQKRALVAATLIATGASDYFTQDMEDFTPPGRVYDVRIVDSTKSKPVKSEIIDAPPVVEDPLWNPEQHDSPAQKSPQNWTVYDAVVEAGLSDNEFSARNALKHCSTGYQTDEKAIAWMRVYRDERDQGKSPAEAAHIANGK